MYQTATRSVIRLPRPCGPAPRVVLRRGFTMVEMLVVIGIIMALMAILLPTVNRAYKIGVRTRMAADLQIISGALEAYSQDHNDYPRVYAAGTGAYVLCRALIAPEAANVDGADGPGFRAKAGGKVWGPYLKTDAFRLSAANEILDRYRHPILYFPGSKGTNINLPGGYLAPGPYGTGTGNRPMFNLSDNTPANTANWAANFQKLMGADASGTAVTPAFIGNYLLWSAGPDEKYGPFDPTQPISTKNRCDDVANFERSEY